MGRFTKQLVVGLAGALALAGGAVADSVLDDFEGGTNQNKFGGYWYFYTNLTASAKNAPNKSECDTKTFSVDLEPEEIEQITNAEKDGVQLKFKGGYGSTVTDPKAGSYSGVMQFGNVKEPWSSSVNKNTWADVYPAVGMGTQLTRDTLNGLGSSFSAIKFWMKVGAGVTSVGFKVETADQLPQNHTDWTDPPASNPDGNKKCPADASYQVYLEDLDDLSTTWKQYEVKIPGDLTRADWEKWKPFTFDAKRATKIAWFVEGAKSPIANNGLLAVDDIEVIGYTYVDPWNCGTCVKDLSATPPSGAVLFSNFDVLSNPTNISMNQNKLGGYWYGYTDEEGRKGEGRASTIDVGQWDDPYYTEGPSLFTEEYGYSGTNGAFIQFTMGEPYKDANGNTVQPFVGLGTDLDTTGYYNGSQLESIWFRYRTSGFAELYVEVHDEYADTHDDAEVFYTKINGTNGEWKVAEIPLSVLKLPDWADKRTGADATLNKAKLKKIQFKNQSTVDGSIQIDDVYMKDPGLGEGVSVKLVGSKAKAAGLRAVYNRGKIGVNWNTASNVSGGRIQLVNTKGRVVASAPITAAAGKVTASLGAGSIPTGMYFVRVNAKDVNGKKIVQQTPISIVK